MEVAWELQDLTPAPTLLSSNYVLPGFFLCSLDFIFPSKEREVIYSLWDLTFAHPRFAEIVRMEHEKKHPCLAPASEVASQPPSPASALSLLSGLCEPPGNLFAKWQVELRT